MSQRTRFHKLFADAFGFVLVLPTLTHLHRFR